MLTLRLRSIKSRITFLIAIFLFCIAFWGLKYTDDWYGYLHFFANPEFSPDLLFVFISFIFGYLGHSYVEVFKFHIFVIGLLYLYFTSRFTKNLLIMTLVLVIANYVTISNQIRFQLAFVLFLLSVYNYFLLNKKVSPFFFFAVSVFSHKAIIPLFFFFIIYNKLKGFNSSTFLNYLFLGNLLFVVVYNILFYLNLGHFQAYLRQEGISSISGGVFNITPSILIIAFIFFKNEYFKWHSLKIYEDKCYRFLFILSIYTFIFALISINVQIFAHRYINIFFIVWITLIIYPATIHSKMIDRFSSIVQGVLLALLFIMWNYFFPLFIDGSSEPLRKVHESLKSYTLSW